MAIRFAVNTSTELLVAYPPYRCPCSAVCTYNTAMELCSTCNGRDLLAKLNRIELLSAKGMEPRESPELTAKFIDFVNANNLLQEVEMHAQQYVEKLKLLEPKSIIPPKDYSFETMMKAYCFYRAMTLIAVYHRSDIIALDFTTHIYIEHPDRCKNLENDMRNLLRQHGPIIASGFCGSGGYYKDKAKPNAQAFNGEWVYEYPEESRVLITPALFPHSILIVGITPGRIYYLDPTIDKEDAIMQHTFHAAAGKKPKLRAMSFPVFINNLVSISGMCASSPIDASYSDGIFSCKASQLFGFIYPAPYFFAARDYGALQTSLAAGGDGYAIAPIAATAVAAATSAHLCATCGKTASQRCNACHTVYYCSRDCQKAHWPRHKPVCTAAGAKPA